jgi:hypothetical protein
VTKPTAERNDALVELGGLLFDNSFVRELPADPLLHNVPRAVRSACYTRVDPTPVRSPQLLAWADPVGEMLGFSRPDSPTGAVAEVLGGNRVFKACSPMRHDTADTSSVSGSVCAQGSACPSKSTDRWMRRRW